MFGGGVIVVPWQPGQGDGQITRLTVLDGAAYGRFHGPCGYMMLRAQRAAMCWSPHHHEDAKTSTTSLDPRVIDEAGTAVRLVATALAPGLGWTRTLDADGMPSLLLFEVGRPDGPWAACDYEPGATAYQVTQYGQRRLWDELEAAYRRWLQHGTPNPGRFGLTVTSGGEVVWLDSPDQPITTRVGSQ